MLLSLFGLFGSCDVERPYYYLEGISLNEIPNFSQDANETGNQALPDIYMEIYDPAGNLLTNTNYLLNVDTNEYPLSFPFDNLIELGDMDYTLDIYDFDEVQHGDPEFLGSVTFSGRGATKTYIQQYNDPALFGTLSVTIDMFIDYK